MVLLTKMKLQIDKKITKKQYLRLNLCNGNDNCLWVSNGFVLILNAFYKYSR